MSKIQEVSLIIVGLGKVGGALLRQISANRGVLAQRRGVHLSLIGLADSQGLLFDPASLSDRILTAALQAKADGYSVSRLASGQPLTKLSHTFLPGTILVDVTASTETEPILRAALKAGCRVVLANKRPLIGPWVESNAFFGHPHLRYEATVGAGLPVISTLRTLLDTGDRVSVIEGVLSGTLGYLCAQLERGIPYSVAVSQARLLGYTEPDPREDLSGQDVARKALILARTAGWPLEIADLMVEPLYPEELASASTEEFMAAIPTLDEEYASRVREAQAGGGVLRYVARVGPDGGRVKLVSVPQGSPLGALHGPGNYVAFYTSRYNETPLVISGLGAGPEVTAAGILGDIISYLKIS